MKGGVENNDFQNNLNEKIQHITDQNELSCILQQNDVVVNFIIEIFFKFCEKVYNINKEHLRKILAEVKENEVITKIGFNDDEVNTIIENIENKTLDNTENILKRKIHATITSFVYSSSTIALLIRSNEEMFKKFITKLKMLFNLPDTFTKSDFDDMYESLSEDRKKSVNYMIVFFTLQYCGEGLYQLNYSYNDFNKIKKGSSQPISIKPNESNIYKCYADIKENIFTLSKFLSIENTFHKQILEKYKRTAIGGVSGSIYMMYFIVIHCLEYEATNENLFKILCISIIDNVPLWHSLEELLMTYSVELLKHNYPINKYTIDTDPVDYFKELLQNINKSKANSNLSVFGFEKSK